MIIVLSTKHSSLVVGRGRNPFVYLINNKIVVELNIIGYCDVLLQFRGSLISFGIQILDICLRQKIYQFRIIGIQPEATASVCLATFDFARRPFNDPAVHRAVRPRALRVCKQGRNGTQTSGSSIDRSKPPPPRVALVEVFRPTAGFHFSYFHLDTKQP